MPCFHPLQGYRALTPNPSGKYSTVFNQKEGYKDIPRNLPCGQCIGCRLKHSKQWAVRCVHESQLHQYNSFVTLTYSDENLPKYGTLIKKHVQDFIKKLRYHSQTNENIKTQNILTDLHKPIRYYYCGEYGEKQCRPHYHICAFNLDFGDKIKWKQQGDNTYYISPTLEKIWDLGHTIIGSLNYKSAAYVARYIMKKQTGKGSEIYYENTDEKTGEIIEIQREYTNMSRRPGIGKTWYEKYHKDLYPDNFVVIEGKKLSVPRYYQNQHEKLEYEALQRIKAKSIVKNKKRNSDNTPDRLVTKEIIQTQRTKQLVRNFETS